ncbi:MAG: urea carboxylase-associated family protein [Candidatus Rokubacteria bacterium]|nr:urea carboxylase-associated family protein [Candidatus Rokubacteria bacterium]
MGTSLLVIPARAGKAVRLAAGHHLKIINSHGTQVVDMWAFNAEDLSELMSMHHTHSCLRKLVPARGEAFYTYRRRPILTFVEDTSPGIHDTVLPACDQYRYIWDGYRGYHQSCGDNLAAALTEVGYTPPPVTPQPFNLFMNCPIGADGRITYLPPATRPGDYAAFRAEMDCVVAMSACPYDLELPVNGAEPKEVCFQLY